MEQLRKEGVALVCNWAKQRGVHIEPDWDLAAQTAPVKDAWGPKTQLILALIRLNFLSVKPKRRTLQTG